VTDPPADLPPLPTLGPVSRQAPPDGARKQWQDAVVIDVRAETRNARTVQREMPQGSPPPVPGQHYVVRVARDDGSWAQRSYSVASAPDRTASPDAAPDFILGAALGRAVSRQGPDGSS
jgi:hypothetical protein